MISDNINKVLKIVIATFFVLFLVKTVQTYYSSLGQYGTGDQTQFSLPRIQKFLMNPDSVKLNECTNLSYLIVGLPGEMLEKHLNKTHKLQDKLYGNIQYTEVFAYSFFQVTCSLIILFYCIVLIGLILKLEFKKDYLYYLIIAIIILNYPTLKGVIKILKYDALSIICTIAAVLNYILYLTREKKKFIIYSSIFSALAFMEKDTSISSIILIIAIEVINLALKKGKVEAILKQIGMFLLIYIGVFIVTTYVLIPELWHIPSNTSILFLGLNDYFQVLSFGLVFFGLIFGFAGIYVIRYFKFRNNNTVKKPIKAAPKQKVSPVEKVKTTIKEGLMHPEYYYAVLAFSVIIFLSALMFQSNNMYDMSTINTQYYNKIKSEQLFVSKSMAQVSISTLDKSQWITRLKVLYNSIRIFVYVTPEIITLIFFFAPLLLLLLHKNKKKEDDISLLILFLFSALLVAAYAFLLAPIEPKYNLLSYTLFIVFSIFLMINSIRYLLPKYAPIILLGVSLLMIRPTVIADPAHFGYKNYFRSVEVENNEFLDLNKYNWWMWLGWGETTYPCFNYVDKTTTGVQKILIDYTPPFAENPRLQPRYNPYFRQTYSDSLRNYLNFDINQYKGFINFYKNDSANKVDYLIISKNVANRGIIGNFILKNFRDKACFVDKIGGVEYGWLFKIDDLYKASQ